MNKVKEQILIYLRHAYLAGKSGSPERFLNDLAEDFAREEVLKNLASFTTTETGEVPWYECVECKNQIPCPIHTK